MEQNDLNNINELFRLSKHLRVPEFENYIAQYLERKADKRLAIEELDRTLALLQSHILTLSIYVKQNFILKQDAPISNQDMEFFTKQELALKYRVSVRTVSNWIIDGLESEEIGGVIRISSLALKTFISTARGKKFRWKSIS